jgi:two-component system LytT family sensor kinase
MKSFDPLAVNRNRLFWALHTAGWTGYGLIQYFGAVLWQKPVAYHFVVAIAAVSGFVLSLPLRWLYRRLWQKPPWLMVTGAVLASYGIALLWRVVIETAYLRLMPPMEEHVSPYAIFYSAASYSMFVLLTWTGLYFGMKYYTTLREERERGLRAAALAQEAQVKMLRYQLNPHFLFNTLNAISTLILDGQNQPANQAVTRLSEFLRYTLDQDPMKKVTLRQEIAALNLYLKTERLRFGDRLRLDFAVETGALDALLPSLLLQPLVENAVKYAIAPREDGGTIRIEGKVRGGLLELAVADDGPGLPEGVVLAGGRGVGIRNTRERLAVVYGDEHRFEIRDARPGVRVEMAMPLEQEDAAR